MGSIFSFASRKSDAPASSIGWESRYDGVLTVAILDEVPFAGISGPWPDGNYALTWWTTRDADAARKLEFHPSLAHACKRVEEMALDLARAA